jgi:hypothetical protein
MSRKDATTLKFDDGIWAPPVETRDELWALAPDGQLCFVKSENEVYMFEEARWVATGNALPKWAPDAWTDD